MEIQNSAEEPKKKKVNDFVKLFLGILLLTFALMALKYAMGVFGVI